MHTVSYSILRLNVIMVYSFHSYNPSSSACVYELSYFSLESWTKNDERCEKGHMGGSPTQRMGFISILMVCDTESNKVDFKLFHPIIIIIIFIRNR